MQENNLSLPILYSFRRCPYAIRARLAIKISRIKVELREILLKDKPKEMLQISLKGTVPVLQLPDGKVIDESRDIIFWALTKNDPKNWLSINPVESNRLIDFNDNQFKPHLDRYKYADRFPENSKEIYRQQVEFFLKELDARLSTNKYLTSAQISLADIAIFPFIRQCAFVDKKWFEQTSYTALQRWLNEWLASELFNSVMERYSCWKSGEVEVNF